MALIILAGGKSVRMGGQDKAQLPLGGNTMVGALLNRIQPLFRETFVVAQDAGPYTDFPVTVIQDRYPGCGPISGIHAGLAASRDHFNFVLACDLPLMRVEMVHFLMQQTTAWYENSSDETPELVIPSFDGFFEPVAAVYAKEVQDVLERMILARDYRLLNILSALRVQYIPEEELRRVDPTLESFINVNTPTQYEHVQDIFRRREEE